MADDAQAWLLAEATQRLHASIKGAGRLFAHAIVLGRGCNSAPESGNVGDEWFVSSEVSA